MCMLVYSFGHLESLVQFMFYPLFRRLVRSSGRQRAPHYEFEVALGCVMAGLFQVQ